MHRTCQYPSTRFNTFNTFKSVLLDITSKIEDDGIAQLKYYVKSSQSCPQNNFERRCRPCDFNINQFKNNFLRVCA